MVAVLAVAGLVGCGESSVDPAASAVSQRPPAPEVLDRISRGVIKAKATRLAASPESDALWMGYGDACLMNLWPEEAAFAYARALESADSLDPILAATVRWRLARALHESGDHAAADAEATAALNAMAEASNGVDFGDGWVTLASWRLDLGDLEGADTALARAKKARPMRRAIVSVQTDIQQDRVDAARATVDEFLGKGVKDRTLNRLAVMVGTAQGDPLLVSMHEANAAESLLVPDDAMIAELHPLARHERADLLRCMAMRESLPPRQALEQIAPYVKQRPRQAMLRVIVADLMRNMGGYAEAKAVLDKVHADDPPDHEYWAIDAIVHLGLVEAGQSELLDRARASAIRAMEINPRLAYGLQIRAMVHEQDGEWTQAAEMYRKAAENAENPEDADRWRGDAMRCDAESVQP